MDRRRFLRTCTWGMVGLGLAGCRGQQTAQVMKPGQADMVGSHTAGAETFKPLVQEATARLLAKHSQGIQPASFNQGPLPMKICFVGVENASSEEIGDFKEQIYEAIDSKIVSSGVYQTVSKRFVDAGLAQTRLRPDILFVPQNMRMFSMYMEQTGQPFDYMLFAKITSGTTVSNKDYQRDYVLTLELVNIKTGASDKESAELKKGYNVSAGAKIRAAL